MQMKLDDHSKQYVTIKPQQDLYCYICLPFGIVSVPAIFQCAMDEILQGISHVLCYLDDIW